MGTRVGWVRSQVPSGSKNSGLTCVPGGRWWHQLAVLPRPALPRHLTLTTAHLTPPHLQPVDDALPRLRCLALQLVRVLARDEPGQLLRALPVARPHQQVGDGALGAQRVELQARGRGGDSAGRGLAGEGMEPLGERGGAVCRWGGMRPVARPPPPARHRGSSSSAERHSRRPLT